MCKYCNHLFDETDERTAGIIIDGGINMGFAKNILYVTTCITKDNKDIPCIRTEIGNNSGSEIVMEKKIKIKYCPICGQKL